MTELRKCPFCGGEARISELTYPMKHYTVICSNEKCYAEMGDFISNEDAIRMWNSRPNPWHTGTPTEEGWYLIQTKRVDVDTGRYIFKVGNLSDVLWFQSEGYKELSCYGIIAWQKIEPYKEKK